MQLVLVLFALLMGALTGVEVHREGLWGLVLASPALAAATLALAGYGVALRRRRGLGLRALYRTEPAHQLGELMATVGAFLVAAPWALTAVATIGIWTGPHRHSLAVSILFEVGSVLLPIVFWLVLYLDARGHGGWWGGGGGPDEPSGPSEPSWWPDFERQFRRYVSERPRRPVSVA